MVYRSILHIWGLSRSTGGGDGWRTQQGENLKDGILVKVSGVGSAMVATYAFTTPLASRLISRYHSAGISGAGPNNLDLCEYRIRE